MVACQNFALVYSYARLRKCISISLYHSAAFEQHGTSRPDWEPYPLQKRLQESPSGGVLQPLRQTAEGVFAQPVSKKTSREDLHFSLQAGPKNRVHFLSHFGWHRDVTDCLVRRSAPKIWPTAPPALLERSWSSRNSWMDSPIISVRRLTVSCRFASWLVLPIPGSMKPRKVCVCCFAPGRHFPGKPMQ